MENTKLIKRLNVRNIGKIYRGSEEAPMRIPNYQRAYAWAKDEISDYISDLLNLEAFRAKGEPRTHFMGGIVAYEEEKEDNFPQKIHYIVDGQQRLITFQITLAIIREEYKTLKKRFERNKNTDYSRRTNNKIEELEGFFEFKFTTTLGDDKKVDILQASPMDQPVLQKILSGEEQKEDFTSESHQLIKSARNKIRKDLVRSLKQRAESDEGYFGSLGVLLDCVKYDCNVIYIVCPNLDDAYELFQVLNDRGKSLTDGDLLRAYTFQEANKYNEHHTYHQALTTSWNEILSSTEGQVKQFLEQYLRMVTGERPQKKQLYRQLQELVFSKDQKEIETIQGQSEGDTRVAKIKYRVSDLRKYNQVFLKLVDADWPYEVLHQSIEDYGKYRLELLVRVLELKNFSILLAAHEKLEQPKFRDLLFIIEKFFFRYRTICGGSTDRIGNVFGRHANRILDDNYNVEVLKQDLRELIEDDATDHTFKSQLRLNLTFKNDKVKQRIRYFLIFLEDHRKFFKDGVSKSEQRIDKSMIYPVEKSNSIEHIYPQNPASNLQDPNIENHESGRDLTNCLGNLTFLGKDENTSLGNKPYLEKKPTFAVSKVWLNQHLADKYDIWSAENILDREKWLLEKATKVFQV